MAMFLLKVQICFKIISTLLIELIYNIPSLQRRPLYPDWQPFLQVSSIWKQSDKIEQWPHLDEQFNPYFSNTHSKSIDIDSKSWKLHFVSINEYLFGCQRVFQRNDTSKWTCTYFLCKYGHDIPDDIQLNTIRWWNYIGFYQGSAHMFHYSDVLTDQRRMLKKI